MFSLVFVRHVPVESVRGFGALPHVLRNRAQNVLDAKARVCPADGAVLIYVTQIT